MERLEREIIQEELLLKTLGITKGALDRLRQEKQFPYIMLAQGVRVYYEPHILAWLKKNETPAGTDGKK